MLPENIPLFRLEDTGMGQQMQEYAVSQKAIGSRLTIIRPLNSNPTGSRRRIIDMKILPLGILGARCSACKRRQLIAPGLPATLLEPQP